MVAKVLASAATTGAKTAASVARQAANDAPKALEPLKRAASAATFRKSSMGEMKTASDTAKRAEAANDSLDEIKDQVADKSADETIAESLTSIDSKMTQSISDNLADSIDQRRSEGDLIDETKIISAKLSLLVGKLTEMHADAQVEATQREAVKQEPTTSEALSALAERNQPQPQAEVADSLSPKEESPSTKLLDDNKGKSGKELVAKANPVVMGLDKVGGLLKTGFKSSIGVMDKISGMLFKYTATQAIQAAKIAAAIFAIILAVDLIKIYWSVWGEKIMGKLSEWAEIFKGWWDTFTDWASGFSDFKTAFEGMGANLMEIKNAWTSGDFPGLAKAIGNALLTLGKTISGVLTRTLSSVFAALLRKLGFGDAADDMEAFGLRHYQNMTDNRLSDENQRKLAENQLKKEKEDGKTTTERGVTDFLPAKWRNKIGFLSDEEYSQVQAEKKDQSARSGLSEEDQLSAIAATNEARESLGRYKKFAEAANANNSADMAKVDKYKKEAQRYLGNKGLDLVPSTKAELNTQFNSIKVKPKGDAVKPASAAESKDTQTVKAIKSAESNKATQQAHQTNVANVQNNVTRNSKSVHVQAPTTSTRAPGVHKATGVN